MTEDTTFNSTLFDTGSVIDNKWVLIERIGKGGMGEVYRAHQLTLRRDVAIKVISEDSLQDIEENPEEVFNAIDANDIVHRDIKSENIFMKEFALTPRLSLLGEVEYDRGHFLYAQFVFV